MTKEEQYIQLLQQAQSFLSGEELILGPFQGPLACTRIPFGKGVCGSEWKREETIVVPDVEKFPGHIACSSESRSEIVVPVWKDDRIIAVLDIDSEKFGTFDDVDRKYLDEICAELVTQVNVKESADVGCLGFRQMFPKLKKPDKNER